MVAAMIHRALEARHLLSGDEEEAQWLLKSWEPPCYSMTAVVDTCLGVAGREVLLCNGLKPYLMGVLASMEHNLAGDLASPPNYYKTSSAVVQTMTCLLLGWVLYEA